MECNTVPTLYANKIIELRQRYINMHRRYFDGLLEQLKVTDDRREFSRDVDEYMHMRRGTIGAYPAIALSE